MIQKNTVKTQGIFDFNAYCWYYAPAMPGQQEQMKELMDTFGFTKAQATSLLLRRNAVGDNLKQLQDKRKTCASFAELIWGGSEEEIMARIQHNPHAYIAALADFSHIVTQEKGNWELKSETPFRQTGGSIIDRLLVKDQEYVHVYRTAYNQVGQQDYDILEIDKTPTWGGILRFKMLDKLGQIAFGQVMITEKTDTLSAPASQALFRLGTTLRHFAEETGLVALHIPPHQAA